MSDSVKQLQQAGDDSTLYQASRDIVISTTINYESRLEVMKALVNKYHEEKRQGQSSAINGYIRKLEKYTTNIDGELSNLEQKLTDGGYENDIDWALELKQEYAMLLHENKFSVATQQIHAYVLAWIVVLYKQFVLDAIRAGHKKEVVKQILLDKVIAPVERLVGGDNNVLELYSDDINGMIYYLTGNCHLKWK